MKRFFVLLLAMHSLMLMKAQDLTVLYLTDSSSQSANLVEYVDSVKCADGKGNVLVLVSGKPEGLSADVFCDDLAQSEKPYVSVNKGRKKIGVALGAEILAKYADTLKDDGCELLVCVRKDGEIQEVKGADIVIGANEDKPGISHVSIDYKKNRLTALYKSLAKEDVIVAGGEWFPYPKYEDREAWAALLGKHAERLVKAGEKYLDYKWQSVDATAYLAYERTGERTVMETPLKENRVALNTLLLAELAEGSGRFVDQLINGTWHLSHSPSWVLSAHLPRQKSRRTLPDPEEQLIDLGSGALGAQMAVTWHFFHKTFDAVDPVISRVIYDAIKKQILDPYLSLDEQTANWWLAFDLKPGAVVNNWNPWCNADVILCFLLMEKDQTRLNKAVAQSVKSVDKFIAYVNEDGACEEGPAYWGHAAGKLYDYLQIMCDASNGRLSIFDDPQVRLMGEYISRSFVNDGWVVNFADASAKLTFSSPLIYNYGKAVNSKEMQDFAIYNQGDKENGKFKSPAPVIWNDVYRSLESLKNIVEMTERVDEMNSRIASGVSFDDCMASLRKVVPSSTWYPQTEFCYFKNSAGWFFASKGGHNNESHNHNDIGTFILYKNAVPMFVDAGVGTYTKATFSSDRYTIWSMQSNWHNLPVINGVPQKNGARYKSASVSVKDSKSKKNFALDISKAYPKEAACNEWRREYVMTDKMLTITDSYSLTARNAADVLNFMVQGAVYLPGSKTDSGYSVNDGEVVVVNEGVAMSLSYPAGMTISVDEVKLDDPRLSNVWGKSIRRISFTSGNDAPVKGKYQFKISEL